MSTCPFHEGDGRDPLQCNCDLPTVSNQSPFHVAQSGVEALANYYQQRYESLMGELVKLANRIDGFAQQERRFVDSSTGSHRDYSDGKYVAYSDALA